MTTNHEGSPQPEIKEKSMDGLTQSLIRIEELKRSLVEYMQLIKEAVNQGISPKEAVAIPTILEKHGLGAMSDSNLGMEISDSLDELSYATKTLRERIEKGK